MLSSVPLTGFTISLLLFFFFMEVFSSFFFSYLATSPYQCSTDLLMLPKQLDKPPYKNLSTSNQSGLAIFKEKNTSDLALLMGSSNPWKNGVKGSPFTSSNLAYCLNSLFTRSDQSIMSPISIVGT